MSRKFSLAYLTIPGICPQDQIRIAAEAGYDFVSLRTIPMYLPGEPEYLMDRDPQLFKETKAALEHYNMKLMDIELARVREDLDIADFEKAFEKIKDQNILCLAGEYDSCAPISEMVQPLWSKLEAHHTQAVQRLKIYPAEHGLLGCRVSAITEIADFLTQICS